jgi:hypothetical protein
MQKDLERHFLGGKEREPIAHVEADLRAKDGFEGV